MTSKGFTTRTLAGHPRGEAVTRILSAALQAVEPGEAVCRFIQRRGQVLLIDGQEYPLDEGGRILFIGLGKAAYAMTLPLAELLSDHPQRGLLIPKQAPAKPLNGFEIQGGGHPIPDEASLQAGEKESKVYQTAGCGQGGNPAGDEPLALLEESSA